MKVFEFVNQKNNGDYILRDKETSGICIMSASALRNAIIGKNVRLDGFDVRGTRISRKI